MEAMSTCLGEPVTCSDPLCLQARAARGRKNKSLHLGEIWYDPHGLHLRVRCTERSHWIEHLIPWWELLEHHAQVVGPATANNQ